MRGRGNTKCDGLSLSPSSLTQPSFPKKGFSGLIPRRSQSGFPPSSLSCVSRRISRPSSYSSPDAQALPSSAYPFGMSSHPASFSALPFEVAQFDVHWLFDDSESSNQEITSTFGCGLPQLSSSIPSLTEEDMLLASSAVVIDDEGCLVLQLPIGETDRTWADCVGMGNPASSSTNKRTLRRKTLVLVSYCCPLPRLRTNGPCDSWGFIRISGHRGWERIDSYLLLLFGFEAPQAKVMGLQKEDCL